MKARYFFVAGLLLNSLQLNANNIYNFSKAPLSPGKCELVATSNALDLALSNLGYFVVSQDKKNEELLFTRYGKTLINADDYIVTNNGFYLLGINKDSAPTKLKKIKISPRHLPPKATSVVHVEINLSATAADGAEFSQSSSITDSISQIHTLNMHYTKMKENLWNVDVSVDKVEITTGEVQFNQSGVLTSQKGLSHIYWPTNYGLNDLKIDLKNSTQYAAPFTVNAIFNNGYPLGTLSNLAISIDGDIYLHYTNGVSKKLSQRIAVANFRNDRYLDHAIDHLYRATEQSGSPELHWRNSEFSVVSGALEEEPC